MVQWLIMVAPIRYTPQKQQEKRSLHQISERLDEFGWMPTRPDEDLGEDLIVHLYFEGKATGVLFHLQAKSITNLHERRKGETLPYRFAVKDLLHWEQFELPVVLVVWDVKLREGRWVLWNTAIWQLDRQNPGWREQKTATVYLPWKNTTDDAGLIELRKGIGRYLFPLLADPKSMELKFKTEFPDTEAGREELEAFKQIIKHGREGTFSSKLIWSGKFVSWFGEFEQVIWSFKQTRHPETYMASLEIIGTSGETSLISNELRATLEDNLETFGFSNSHIYSTFILLDIIISRNPNENILNFEINQTANVLGHDANEAYNNLRFWQLLGKGGMLRLRMTVFGGKMLTCDMPAQDESFMLPPEIIDLVSKLRVIQNRTGNFFEVPFFDVWSDQDELSIKKFYAVIQYGKLTAKVKEFSFIAKSIEVMELFLDIQRKGKKDESLREIY
jgi:hypothetical protein